MMGKKHQVVPVVQMLAWWQRFVGLANFFLVPMVNVHDVILLVVDAMSVVSMVWNQLLLVRVFCSNNPEQCKFGNFSADKTRHFLECHAEFQNCRVFCCDGIENWGFCACVC